jgi:hypothetical protein
MKAIKVMATIDEHGQLTLDCPLITDKNSRVEVIVLISEAAEIDDIRNIIGEYEQRGVENEEDA